MQQLSDKLDQTN